MLAIEDADARAGVGLFQEADGERGDGGVDLGAAGWNAGYLSVEDAIGRTGEERC